MVLREKETSLGLERRGGKIEQMAKIWAEEQLRRTVYRERLAKKGSAIRVVDRRTLEGPLKLPKLVPQDQGEASLRFDPTGKISVPGKTSVPGSIYVPIWRGVSVAVDGKRRFLPKAENFEQFTRPRERELNLNNLPDRRVEKLTMACSPDIDTAIRQAFHIRGAYSFGKEARQLEVIWEGINQAWDLVLEQRVNKDNLGQLAEKTALVLAKARLTQAEKAAKVNIETRLSGVFQTDSLGRLNPLVQRIRLRSAFLEAVGLEAFSVLVSEKFAAIEGVLMMEREITRQSIADARSALDTVMGFNKRGAWVFEGGIPRKGELEGLRMALYGVVLLLNRPRVAPYLPITRSACIALWGCRPEEVAMNRKIIGQQAGSVLLDSDFISVRELLMKGRFAEAKDITKQWVFDPLTGLI